MIVVDTSAWTELFRRTGSEVDRALRARLARPEDVAVTEVVVMEVLAGARSAAHLRDLRRLLLGFDLLPLHGLHGYERAAELYRRCRAAGETVRKTTDCLVAAAAIERGATVLARDRDFDVLARHTPLRLEPLHE